MRLLLSLGWRRICGVAKVRTCDPQEDDAVVLEHADVHLAHLVVCHGAVREILVDLPLHSRASVGCRHCRVQVMLTPKALGWESAVLGIEPQIQSDCQKLTGGSAMMTPNLPSTVMSNVRTSILSHCGSGSACKECFPLQSGCFPQKFFVP